MFKIVETSDCTKARHAMQGAADQAAGLSRHCISEEWSADLDEGTISLGHWSSALHGLTTRHCGLMGLLRAYEAMDRRHILGLFEKAAAAESSFCFSAMIALAQDQAQPVFCVAHSVRERPGSGLSLSGIFLFPRFRLDGRRQCNLTGSLARLA